MIAALKRRMPVGLHKWLIAARDRWQIRRFRRALSQIRLVPSPTGIHVNYGSAQNYRRDGVVQGGRVKLLYLQREFPERLQNCNLLYLVSSAQPPFAVELARWAKRQGVKLVWNQNGVAYPAWAGASYAGINAPMRELRGMADYVIYQSEFCRSSAARYLGECDTPACVLPNCVDTEWFRPLPEALPDNPWVILAAGSHQQPERVWSVLEVLAHLRRAGRDVRLLLAGRLDWTNAAAQTRTAIERLQLVDAVEIVPPYSQYDAPALFRRAHVLLHTKYKDPCPTVVIEAMACGVPVVGSASGGMPELVEKDAGVLIEVPDSDEKMHYPATQDLAEAVAQVMGNLKKLRWGARQRALEHYDIKPWLKRHREIFSAVLGHS